MVNFIVNFFNKRYQKKLEKQRLLEESPIIKQKVYRSKTLSVTPNKKLGISPLYDVKYSGLTYGFKNDDDVKKKLNNSIQYANYIANTLNESINFSEYIAEKLDKSIQYSEYIAEQLGKESYYGFHGNYGTSGIHGNYGTRGSDGTSGIHGNYGIRGSVGQDCSSISKKKEIKRVYSEMDPYGEEDWSEN